MNDITALSYVGIHSARLSDWSSLATGVLGLQPVPCGARHRRYRMDGQAQRLIIEEAPGEALAYLGFEVADAAALQRLCARLQARGCEVTAGTRAMAEDRAVGDLAYCLDPEGNRLEFVVSPHQSGEPFSPARPISGFRTGALGMGHAVLHVQDVNRLLPFYRDGLGFAVSDYGLTPYGLYFFHVNARHHSLAMVGSGQRGLHHFMVELQSLDDVGQGYDLALLERDRIAYTLGRHTNDFMTSFYVNTPSGFLIEYGWGGRTIDPASWMAHETTCGPSLWGHDRLQMPAPLREKMTQMRLQCARDGRREPVQVMPGNYEVSQIV